MNRDNSGNPLPEISSHDIPEPESNELPSNYAERIGDWYSEQLSKDVKGQVFTPRSVASFMAKNAFVKEPEVRILDPGAGIGILGCAVIEELVDVDEIETVYLDAVESDSRITNLTNKVLQYASDWLETQGKKLEYTVIQRDFITTGLDRIGLELTKDSEILLGNYHIVILNPPYFKIPSTDNRVKAVSRISCKQTNIYSLFLTVSAHLLKQGGILISINPRSFASGRYLQAFRKFFFEMIKIKSIHIFGSRKKVFSNVEILQETVIIVGEREPKSVESFPVKITSSDSSVDLSEYSELNVDLSDVVSKNIDRRLAIPTSPMGI